mmetsp:Transcript_3885/g.9060  ORF Transcript_3885/g.9060 Transcript_3885/m.9060 type:complete len:219 (-) Transcript_3885:936-1592(-)
MRLQNVRFCIHGCGRVEDNVVVVLKTQTNKYSACLCARFAGHQDLPACLVPEFPDVAQGSNLDAIVRLNDAPAPIVPESELVCKNRDQEYQLFLRFSFTWPTPIPPVDGGLHLRRALLVPVVALCQRYQGEGTQNQVLGQIIDICPTRTDGWQVGQFNRWCLYLFATADDSENCRLPNALVPEQVPMLDQLVAAKRNLPIVRNMTAIDGSQDIADVQC